jgi:hypothetical protein
MKWCRKEREENKKYIKVNPVREKYTDTKNKYRTT